MRRMVIAGTAVLAVTFGAAPAAEAFTPTGATFTMSFSGTYSSSTITELTAKPGCGAQRGRAVTSQLATIKTTQRVRIERRRTLGGLEFLFFPTKRTAGGRPFPVTIDLRESQRQAFEDTSRNDRVIEDESGQTPDRCEQGAFAPVPDRAAEDHRCLLKGTIIPIEARGKVRSDFSWFRRDEKPCGFGDPDGYPGRTNFLKLRAAAPQTALYGKKVNVLKDDARDVEVTRSADDSSTAVKTVTNEAGWTMKLTRLTPWRPLRR